MESKSYKFCRELSIELPEKRFKESFLEGLIRQKITTNPNKVKRYISFLIEFGFIKKIGFDEYEKRK